MTLSQGRGFRDYFSGESQAYAEFRPRYPEELFDWLAGTAPLRDLAWDAATGTGQAAEPLAERFARVIATDASATQLAGAEPAARAYYVRAFAERAPLGNHSVSLVTVAQALHWLELPLFYSEVRRVLKSGGVIAAWCYGLHRFGGEIDAVVQEFYDAMGPWWSPERGMVDDGYRSVPFPFARLTPPPMAMQAEWTLPHLVGYLGTWSAVRRCRADTGTDPRQAVTERLAAVWGDPHASRAAVWDLSVLAGRVGRGA